MTCKQIAPGVHVCGTDPKHVTVTGRKFKRWCFSCRKRVMMIEKRIYEPYGYYDPEYFLACPNGTWHRTEFPT